MSDRDVDLDAVRGKTFQDYEFKRLGNEEGDPNKGEYDILILRFTDGSSVTIASSDADGYQSWLEVERA